MTDVNIDTLKKDIEMNTEFRVKVTKVLFGNGEKGMDEVVRDTSTAVDLLTKSFNEYKQIEEIARKEVEKDKKEDRKQLKYLALATISPYLISFLIWIIYWAVKLQPLLEHLEPVTK